MEDREFLQGMLEVLVNAIKAHAIVVMESNSQIVAAIEAHTSKVYIERCEHKNTENVCVSTKPYDTAPQCLDCGMIPDGYGKWNPPRRPTMGIAQGQQSAGKC